MSEVYRKANVRDTGDGRSVHDVGGLPSGPVDRNEHDLTFYERRVDALLMLLVDGKRQAFRVDALRRAVEEFNQTEYDGTPYYDRWISAIRNLLVEQDILTADEIERKVQEICVRHSADGIEIR